MRLVLAFCIFLTSSAVYAAESTSTSDDDKIIQSQLSIRWQEEMNKAMKCAIDNSHLERSLVEVKSALKDADQTQDELQDAND